MNTKKIFKLISYSLLAILASVISFLGFERGDSSGVSRFKLPNIPTADADVPAAPAGGSFSGDGDGDGGGGDA